MLLVVVAGAESLGELFLWEAFFFWHVAVCEKGLLAAREGETNRQAVVGSGFCTRDEAVLQHVC